MEAKVQRDKVMALYSKYKDEMPTDKAILFKQSLENASDECYESVSNVKTMSSTLVCILSIFLGWLGVDRFAVGDFGLGFCKLLFGWMTFGIWPFMDIFFSYKRAKENNYITLSEAIF